jgi:hypothetical protein
LVKGIPHKEDMTANICIPNLVHQIS